jgi:carboxylesterase
MLEPLLIAGAEPFLFPGSRTGCLLVHGLTGTPMEMRWMGEFLSSRGYTVLAPRLAGHATRPDDLTRVRWRDWLAVVEDGFRMLSGCCDQVFILGLSLGGVLCLTAASYLPVSGIVAISTPFALPKDWRLNFIRIFKAVMPKIAKSPANWFDPEAARTHIEYPYHLTAAAAELKDLLEVMRAGLPAVRAPALLIHSRQDIDVPPENMQRIYEGLGSADKKMLWVERSSHNIVRDAEREIVFQAAHEFIQGCLQGAVQPAGHPAQPTRL